ncbi:glycosyltransferase family 2 protein [Leuconostoc citreum]|uniref:glycosyltransferase family 2 protein n=2 Tax=Leuconostoc citreum TaxID=33964 RepID=UPI001C1F6545|nr:glycosyltransferase family 2 protein [Leuconostoc citreum]MBU7451101.1 glycosyltransferase [Leuconostoc citreum]
MTTIMLVELLVILLILASYILGQRYHFFRQLLLALYVVTMSVYIIWRLGWTLPHDNVINMIAGGVLAIAEIGGFVLSLVFYRIFWRKFTRPKVNLNVFQGKYPTIDIFIATYNESSEILRRSIVAAKIAHYPHGEKVNIYVGDDGDRPEVAALSKELAVHYVTRATHEHAKAGNLNNMLSLSHGDLIVTMDADMVMRQDFLEKTIGYFHEPKMGFIQTPQTFFNQDPYQFNLFAGKRIGNDQDFFMRRIEAQKDAFNAVMYVGSNAVFKRQAIESINGFTTGVITEDMATGMFLQAKGWQSGFINENLASGLAPETFGDLIKQRDRWARGNIQVAKKWNPWRIKGLTFMQKLLYVDGIHYWFSGIYKTIFLIAPVFFLLFGIYSLKTDLGQILIFWVPSFLASMLAFNLVAEKKQTTLLSNVYEVATAPFMAFAVFNELFLKSKKGFAVTRKGVNSDASYYNWGTSWPIIFLLILSAISFIRGLAFVTHYWESSVPIESIYINLYWLVYNLVGLILATYVSNERPRLRQSERFSAPQHIRVTLPDDDTVSGTILDWNESGARIQLEMQEMNSTNLGTGVMVINHVDINFKKVWQKKDNNRVLIGVTFDNLSDKAYAYILSQTYAKSSYCLTEQQYNNRIWYLFVIWWLDVLKQRKAHTREDK